MNHSGDAAEQIIRMSLEGTEVALKVTGNVAKEVAILLIAALKNHDKNLKLKGPARLASMLKSGKQMESYSIKERDLKTFVAAAKDYGIVYCVIRNRRNTPDGLVDIMVKAEDAPRLAHISDRFHFAALSRASIEQEIMASREEHPIQNVQAEVGLMQAADKFGKEVEMLDENDTEKLLDDLMGPEQAQPEQASQTPAPEQTPPETPLKAQESKENAGTDKEAADNRPLAGGEGQKGHQSEGYSPTLKHKQKSTENCKSKQTTTNKPSVKQQLREIAAGLEGQKKEKNAQNIDGPKISNMIKPKNKGGR